MELTIGTATRAEIAERIKISLHSKFIEQFKLQLRMRQHVLGSSEYKYDGSKSVMCGLNRRSGMPDEERKFL